MSHFPRALGNTALTALMLGLVVTTAWAQRPSPATRKARAESLTLTLLRGHAEANAASPGERAAAVRRVVTTAAARRTEIAAIIADDPGAVLRLAMATAVRDALPEPARQFVEQHVNVEGELEVVNEDYDWGARVRYFLHAGGRRLSLHLASPPPDVLSGDVVQVQGVELGDAVAAEGGTGGSIQLVSTALPYTFGEQRALWILVNFQDKATEPYTVSAAHSMLFTTVSNFYRENSQNQTWFTGDVVGWFTIPMSSTVCDAATLRTLARQAAQDAGVDLAQYRRFVYGFPSNACTWWGLGLVGGSSTYALVNGSIALRVVGHELGHNFGLYHAHALECGSATLGTSCSTVEYGDPVDIMGISGVVAHFTAFAKERLGWLNYGTSLPILTVNGSGTYEFDTYAGTTTGPRALKIVKEVDAATGKKTHYYVEYRRGVNGDGGLANNANLTGGVVVHTGSESTGNSSFVLDMTPETSSWNDPALAAGRTFTDATAGLSFTTVSTAAGGASVFVEFGGAACVPAAPTVSLTPTQTQWGAPGSALGWTMTVKNNDGTACAPSTFTLASAVPAGWSGALSSGAVALGPGETGSATMQVTSPFGVAEGYYDVQGRASRSAQAAAATATYAVMSSFSVQVATSAASYSRSQSVGISVVVSSPVAAVSGAPVTLVITKPSGKKATASLTTDAGGRASYTLKLRPKDPVGTWTVEARATLNGVTSSGTTTFELR